MPDKDCLVKSGRQLKGTEGRWSKETPLKWVTNEGVTMMERGKIMKKYKDDE